MAKRLWVCSLGFITGSELQLSLSLTVFLQLNGNENCTSLLGTLLNLSEIILYMKPRVPCT